MKRLKKFDESSSPENIHKTFQHPNMKLFDHLYKYGSFVKTCRRLLITTMNSIIGVLLLRLSCEKKRQAGTCQAS